MARQHHIQIEYGDVGEYALLAGDPGRVPRIARYFENPEQVSDNRGYVTWRGMLEGVRVGAVTQGIGAPSAAIVIEELIKAGVRTIVRVGTSGGVARHVKAGDLVVASAAVRHEGLTLAYLPPEYPAVADPEVAAILFETARKLNLPCHLGLVESKDSYYGQVEPDSSPMRDLLGQEWRRMMESGVLATEMECSPLFIIGTVRKIRTGAIVKVMVNHNTAPELVVNDEDDLIQAAVEALKQIIRHTRHLCQLRG